jgi:ABC-type branched-subunit amino acid transport system ATPase component/ABC-type branched-subunit amino acid transport system permease subunit
VAEALRQPGVVRPSRRLRSEIGTIGGAAVLGILAVAAGPYVLDAYSVNILVRSFLYGSIAITVDILWGFTGVLSFGQSAFFAIGAYACGLAFTHLGLSGATAIGALIGGVACAALVAVLVGWLAFGYGVTQLYVSVVTLVLSVVVVQLLYSGGDFTGSSSGLSGFDTFDLSIEAWFWIAGAALVLTTVLGWVLVRSDFGRLLVAIRDNEQRCTYFGISAARVKTLVVAASAVVAALAGYAYAAYTDVVAPDLAGFAFGTELVIWVALGGRGTLLGPAAAAVVIDFMSAYLSVSLPFIWQLFVGGVFVLVIVLLPQGLGPAIGALLMRLWPWRPATPAVAGLAPAPAGTLGPEHAVAAIDVHGMARHYGSLRVLEDISFVARQGELVSLVGPNGAGKTTLIRCISDGHERSAGSVAIQGRDIGRLAPEHCVRLGIGRKFQTPNVFDTLTVAESLRIARTRLEPLPLWRRDDTVHLPEPALQVVRSTGLDLQLMTEVRHLSHGTKQALELAMVLAMQPAVLLLDEPTAGLTKPERTMIGTILVDLVANHRLCILLVEHDLEFVREISSRIIVLHQGRIVLDGNVEEVVSSELVRTIYIGESHAFSGSAE